MGAAEWTGYSTSGPDSSSYAPYSPQLSSAAGYSYDQTIITPETVPIPNYHLPPVLPQDGIAQSYCPTEYPSASSSLAQSGMIGCASNSYPGKSSEMEQYYGSWNGYNNYQSYPCPPPVPALPPSQPYNPTPTMVLYPQLYSTVNQNQIHLHLHGTGPEKLEQYLDNFTIGSISTDGMSNLNRNLSGLEVGTPEALAQEPPAIIIKHQQEEPEIQDNQEVIGDSDNIKWRPYYPN